MDGRYARPPDSMVGIQLEGTDGPRGWPVRWRMLLRVVPRVWSVMRVCASTAAEFAARLRGLDTERRGGALPRSRSRGSEVADTMKIVIFILSIGAIVLGYLGYSQGGVAAAKCLQNTNNQVAYNQCLQSTLQTLSKASNSGVLLLGGAFLAAALAWLIGLVLAIVRRRWGWFFGILFFSPLATLLYSVFGPDGTVFDALLGRSAARAAGGRPVAGFDVLPNTVQPGLCWQCGGRVKLDSRICLNCGATQSNYSVGPSLATQMSGFNPENATGAFPHMQRPAANVGWTPPPPGYQQPGPPPDQGQGQGWG